MTTSDIAYRIHERRARETEADLVKREYCETLGERGLQTKAAGQAGNRSPSNSRGMRSTSRTGSCTDAAK